MKTLTDLYLDKLKSKKNYENIFFDNFMNKDVLESERASEAQIKRSLKNYENRANTNR